MSDNKKTRRKFLKLLGVSTFSLYFGCSSATYFNLRKDCKNEKEYQKRIRIMSFNIANARGNNDDFFSSQPTKKIKRNLDWIAAVIRNYNIDIVCLNEVDFNSIRTQGIDMAKYIADKVCYNHIISEKLFSLPSVLEVGNAVISRYPLKLNMYHQYGDTLFNRARHAFKSFLDFDVLFDSKNNLNIVQTHLDNQSEEVRCEQAKVLRSHLEVKYNPFVLLGDFNSTANGQCFQHILNNNFVSNPYLGKSTYPSGKPDVQIDYILTSPGLVITDYHTIPTKVSDHLPVIGDIAIE